jgi:integrase
VRLLARFLGDRRPDRAAIRDFLASLSATRRASTVHNRYRGLTAFFKWYAEEEGGRNPMAGVRPPLVPEAPPGVLSVAELGRLLAACAGRARGPPRAPEAASRSSR